MINQNVYPLSGKIDFISGYLQYFIRYAENSLYEIQYCRRIELQAPFTS